ncbi:MAG: universal stress protein [Desulfocapsa sp.]|nr:universal stress protein [Desulfocapsa sp.]
MQKEILVAVDGSVYSNQSLHYLANLFGSQTDILFHLCTWVTTTASIMPSAADQDNSLIPSGGPYKKEAIANRYLKKASEKLVRAGLDPECIHTSIEVSGYNIAATIQQTSKRKLVDSILVGRRGLNGISEMLMGSVSASLFKKCHTTPLWIIDGEVESKNFLVSVDGSPNALLATDHIGHIFNGRDDIQIFLFHCSTPFGKKVVCNPELFYHTWEKKWCDSHLSGTKCLFHGPSQLLQEAGIPEQHIHILPEKSDLEEAHGIIREARNQECGTIVMGRRGAGIAKGLFGGVSDRAIKNSQNLALWVVG